MRSFGVVVAAPALDDDAGLGKAVEDLTVQKFVAQLGVEALAVSVLPRTARLDERRLGADRRDLVPHGPGHELGTVVGADVSRHATQDEEVGQNVDDVR